MQSQHVEPLWDEGISSFLANEYEKKQIPLTSSDLRRLATERAVRVGDLLETLYLLAIYGAWHYCDEAGKSLDLDEEALDEFYAKGRIGHEDLAAFSGVWLPAI